MRFIPWVVCTCLWVFPGFAEDRSKANYVLTIDGVEYPLALGAESTVKLKTGMEVSVSLKKNEFGSFQTGDLSFEFPGQYSVASSEIDEEITQHIVVTANGTMMLVQNHQGGSPSGLIDLMFDEMVEEPKAMGLDIERTDITRTIAGHAELKGVRAHYKGNGDDVTIDIVLAESGDDGFMILTMYDDLSEPDERPIIERFWESVALKNQLTP